jgi:hypothetical protein
MKYNQYKEIHIEKYKIHINMYKIHGNINKIHIKL